jgi:hypothetical protein
LILALVASRFPPTGNAPCGLPDEQFWIVHARRFTARTPLIFEVEATAAVRTNSFRRRGELI